MNRDDFKKEHNPDPQDVATQNYIRKIEDENAELKKRVGTDENLFDYIRSSILAQPKPERVKYDKPKLSHTDVEATLILTDAHAEEFVSLEEMEGLAHYDWQTFNERMDRVVSKTIELINIMRQASNVQKLNVWCLGDWFVGQILPHEESYGVTMPLPVAVPKVGFSLARAISGLSGHFDNINVVGICGNHGRMGRKPVYKMTADRNWDMPVYMIAQEATKNHKNVSWSIPKSIMHVENVMGYNCLLTHSGEVNMNNRTPYYPIESTVDQEHKARHGTDKDFTYFFTGHWHHHAVLDGNIVLCPSMVGANQFSRFKLHKVARPEQLLCFFTGKHGLTTQWPIKF
jgi:hypothetical protein